MSLPPLQDLYIQAMAAIKALPHTNPESFFQQASIHGGWGCCCWVAGNRCCNHGGAGSRGMAALSEPAGQPACKQWFCSEQASSATPLENRLSLHSVPRCHQPRRPL